MFSLFTKIRRADLPESIVTEKLGTFQITFIVESINLKTGEEKRFYDKDAESGYRVVKEKCFFKSKKGVYLENNKVSLYFRPPSRGVLAIEAWCRKIDDLYYKITDSYARINESLNNRVSEFESFEMSCIYIYLNNEVLLVYSSVGEEEDYYSEIVVSLSHDLVVKEVSIKDY